MTRLDLRAATLGSERGSRKGVLTGEAFGVAEIGGIEDEDRCEVGGELPGLVLQLQGRKEDMRWRFGTMAGDEKHEGELSPVVGRRWSRDPLGRLEETVLSSETWGKSIDDLRGFSTRKESSNGGLSRRLHGGEQWWCRFHHWGKREEKGALCCRTMAFYRWRGEVGERQGPLIDGWWLAGPTAPARRWLAARWSSSTRGAHDSLVPGSLPGGASVGV
jgi:hypothetical protein